MKLYERDRSEDKDPSRIPADLVHHFLLGLCSRPGFGICFKDRGWYPREQDVREKVTQDDPDSPVQKGSKIYNKILSNILRTLKVNEDPRARISLQDHGRVPRTGGGVRYRIIAHTTQ